ncbi:MAG: UPF0182 family protein [Acidimicrobiia bacterium]
MRVPTDMPRRRRFHLRGWLIALAVIVVLVLLSLRGLAGFYTDFLWFDSLGQGNTWSSLLAAKVAPALVFTVVFFAIMYANLVIADRLAPKYRSMGPEDELIARYQSATGRFSGRIRIGVAVFFALVAGIGVSSQWKQWVLFTNATDFGVKDPQFNMDVGFYVFKLPFLEFITQWLFAGLVIVLIVTAVEHYMNGGIRFQSPFQRVTPQVKAHLSVILAVMALVKTAQYWLGRYELTLSSRGVVEGAGYTDVNAELPALNMLVVISIFAAALFIWNIWRRGWVLPILAVGLWAFVSVVIGTIYPAAIQQFKVGPNEYQTEAKYIDRNIRATRVAFGLDKVEPEPFNFTSFADVSSPEEIVGDTNAATIENARLWDPDVIAATYNQLQKIQTYYQIGDVDVDRYLINNEIRQVLVTARNLNSADLPSQSFVNRHIVYTHGYGVVASPSNQVEQSGTPSYYLRDVPVETVPNAIALDKGPASEIYFGEGLSSYVLVDAEQKEFNYQTEGKRDQFTRYKGADGVMLSNFVRRAAFALRFGSIDPLISGQVTPKTRVLMERDIRARVEKLAPFLRLDADPYPVVLGDKTVWMMDGYTASDMYPYSQSTGGEGALTTSVNYVRNSVKVAVDAYQGTVKFYVFDEKDPIIRAWRGAFPDLFTDKSEMPEELVEHLRYPEDLFKMQSDMYGRYHVTESRRFYDGSGKWLVSPDPGSSVTGDAATFVETGGASASNEPQAATSTGRRVDPYYLYLKLPGDEKESFIALEPFVPVSSGNSINRLSSFLTAKSDPGSYGKLQSFVMPNGSNVFGPLQVDNEINRAQEITQAFTFLNQQGSTVIKGSLQLIPVGNSIIYVRPIYVRSSGSSGFPQFQFVAVFTQGKTAVCAPTIEAAIDRLFVDNPGQQVSSCTTQIASAGDTGSSSSTTTTTRPGSSTTTTSPPASGTAQQKLDQAAALFDQADQALANKDLATYQSLVNQAKALVKQAQAQLGGGSG